MKKFEESGPQGSCRMDTKKPMEYCTTRGYPGHFGFHLLAEPQEKCRGLRQRLQCLFGFESGVA